MKIRISLAEKVKECVGLFRCEELKEKEKLEKVADVHVEYHKDKKTNDSLVTFIVRTTNGEERFETFVEYELVQLLKLLKKQKSMSLRQAKGFLVTAIAKGDITSLYKTLQFKKRKTE